ncbi:MAG: PQQ-binding-like beta-propeller repeat protein [Pirellulaceae bacterium]
MLRALLTVVVLLAGFPGMSDWAWAEHWPCWRGPRGDGTSREERVPLRWDGKIGEGIIWKTPIPGVGHASPIVWADRMFLVTCLEDREDRILLCVDRSSGKILWQRTVVHSHLETKHSLNSYASSTPATDGELVYVTFLENRGDTVPALNVSRSRPVTAGRMVVAAYDFNGNQRWRVRPGEFASVHGFCSSPLLFEDTVIINGDHDGDSYMVALRKSTGETVWKVPREHKTRSYVVPIIREIEGRTQMVFSGSRCIVSLDPRDGSRHWKIDGPTEQYVASLVCDGKMFYMTAGFPTYHVMGIRPGGIGNVTDTHVAWHVTNARCYVPSPVVVGGYLFIADDRGTANCFEASTGRRLWQERLGKHYSASLVTARGYVFFLADDGIMKIIEPGPELKVIAENALGEYCYASPALSDGHIYLRGETHLVCIGTE